MGWGVRYSNKAAGKQGEEKGGSQVAAAQNETPVEN